jgi:hypothetical protein
MKLLFFAATLAILPISSYFLTEKYVWSGSSSTGCSHKFVLISSSRQLQLCRDHRHMCGQHRPNCVHRRFFDGRQAIVQGIGGEETVRNQEGAINWVITHCVCRCRLLGTFNACILPVYIRAVRLILIIAGGQTPARWKILVYQTSLLPSVRTNSLEQHVPDATSYTSFKS